jgi:hypothetical protein
MGDPEDMPGTDLYAQAIRALQGATEGGPPGAGSSVETQAELHHGSPSAYGFPAGEGLSPPYEYALPSLQGPPLAEGGTPAWMLEPRGPLMAGREGPAATEALGGFYRG